MSGWAIRSTTMRRKSGHWRAVNLREAQEQQVRDSLERASHRWNVGDQYTLMAVQGYLRLSMLRLWPLHCVQIHGEVRFDQESRALYATDSSNYRQVLTGKGAPPLSSPLRRSQLAPGQRIIPLPHGNCCGAAYYQDCLVSPPWLCWPRAPAISPHPAPSPSKMERGGPLSLTHRVGRGWLIP